MWKEREPCTMETIFPKRSLPMSHSHLAKSLRQSSGSTSRWCANTFKIPMCEGSNNYRSSSRMK